MAIRIEDEYTNSNPADGNYPEGSFKNISAPGLLDGTPFEKAWPNDIYGFLQKLLDVAGITPSGDPDTVLASDYYDALLEVRLKRSFSVGSLIEYYGANPNTDIYAGSGVVLDRASYPLLEGVPIFPDMVFTERTSGGGYSSTFGGVAHNSTDALYIAAGVNGEIQSSIDLSTWTSRLSAAVAGFTCCATGNDGTGEVYLAGGAGLIYRSVNGTTGWAAASSVPSGATVFDIKLHSTYGWIACCSNGEIWTSTDSGDNWSLQTTPASVNLFAISVDGPLIVAVGGPASTIITATDPTGTWTPRTPDATAGAAGAFRDIVWSGEKYLIGGSGFISPYFIQTGIDGISWVAGQHASAFDVFGIEYGNGVFVIKLSSTVQRSYDAEVWGIQSPNPATSLGDGGVIEVGGIFIFAGSAGTLQTAPSTNFLIPTFASLQSGFTQYMCIA